MEDALAQARSKVAETMARLYRRGLTTSLGGNVSVRVDGNSFLITPSGLDKSSLSGDQIAQVTMEGKNLSSWKLSIETGMHRLIYMARPDVRAIVHAHPIYVSAFSALEGCPVDTRLTAEAWWQLGEVAIVPYARMGTEELARKVAEKSLRSDVLVMENHGVTCLGGSLLEAFEKIDVLERCCQMTVIAWQATQKGIAVRDLDQARRDALRT